MTYMMRDRPDGQVEIVLTRQVLVGVFPERDTAHRFVTFLRQDEPELIEEEPSAFGRASRDVADAMVDDDLVPGDIVQAMLAAPAAPQRAKGADTAAPPPIVHKAASTALVALPDTPRMPVLQEPKAELTAAQLEEAFGRIGMGEKVALVAASYGVSFGSLRALWANHCRYLQKHLAEGGQVACTMCTRPFIPSISHPDTCARCSHE